MESVSAKGEALTRREREVVILVAEGLTNREIAEGLSISHATVRTHLTSIFLKLGLRNRSKLSCMRISTDRLTPQAKNTIFVRCGL